MPILAELRATLPTERPNTPNATAETPSGILIGAATHSAFTVARFVVRSSNLDYREGDA